MFFFAALYDLASSAVYSVGMLKLCVSLIVFFLSATLSRTQAPPRLVFGLRGSYTFNTDYLSRVQPCRFSGTPTPMVTWTIDGSSLPTSREEARGGIYYFPANGTLVIGGAGSSNNGAYTCTGKNVFGVRSASTQFTFTSTGVRWYVEWYMWFLYAIIIWSLTIPLFVLWFFYRKKKANADLPAPDGWIGN